MSALAGENVLWARMSGLHDGPYVSLRAAPDPFGPVNKILTLVHNDGTGSTRIGKSVLARVPAGAVVKLERAIVSVGYVAIAYPGNLWSSRWQQADDGWYVEVDGRTVLTVADAELHTPYVAPRVPLSRRLRSWATKHARSAADGAAGRLGYVREGEGGEW